MKNCSAIEGHDSQHGKHKDKHDDNAEHHHRRCRRRFNHHHHHHHHHQHLNGRRSHQSAGELSPGEWFVCEHA